jgi:hypothetical protein
MICTSDGDRWCLEFSEIEAQLLVDSMTELVTHYETAFEDLPQSVRDHWRGKVTNGNTTDLDLVEEQQQLEEERLSWRSARLPILQGWLSQHRRAGAGKKWSLLMSPADLELFIIILNDRRLTIASQFIVSEDDMDLDPREVEDEIRRQVLWEIHLLGYFQEICLVSLRDTHNN